MDCVILKPNDRICLGPSAFFLFKNKAEEENASMPDTDEDPITFDDASEEIVKYDTKIEEEEQKAALDSNMSKIGGNLLLEVIKTK